MPFLRKESMGPGTTQVLDILKYFKDFLKFESSLDYFGGLKLGDFPWNSPEVYEANLQSFSSSLSMNLTFTNKFQLGNLVRFGIEFEFVPVLLGLHTDVYGSSVLNDNCFMMSGEV